MFNELPTSAKLEELPDIAAAEDEVYSHLANFFRRYYKDGDFISQRRYKEGVYAIPYEGEEVKLHWANADQYYIKTSEQFRDYTFQLADGRRVHFKLTDADTEHNNNRAASGQERRFILADVEPVSEVDGELVVRMEYRPGEAGRKQRDYNDDTVRAVLAAGAVREWRDALARPAREGPDAPSLLQKHLNTYTAKNTFDYFIHKDLGTFLRRELDFYLKNEVMHLDDIDNDKATGATVDGYLAKLRAIRRVAHQVIDFVAQLEDFQKKLWLKKKFVVETSWCVTLDLIDPALYPEIAANERQREEWVRLFAIDELRGNLLPYTEPLTMQFLEANPFLPVDTTLFPDGFTQRLLAGIGDLDETANGLLVHSENFQALSLLQARYAEQVKCVYIDPPYNTGNDSFVYRDGYSHSSWLALFDQLLPLVKPQLAAGASFFASCDDNESGRMRDRLDVTFGSASLESQIIVQSNRRGQTYKSIAKTHEYMFAYGADATTALNGLPKEVEDGETDQYGPFESWELRNRNPKFGRFNRPNLYYPIYVSDADFVAKGFSLVATEPTRELNIPVVPTNSAGEDSCWRWSPPKVEAAGRQGDRVLVGRKTRTGDWRIFEKSRKSIKAPKSIWDATEVINERGTVEVGAMGLTNFGFPKPLGLLETVTRIGMSEGDLVIDYFAGSGTTAHATINLNREDDGGRKYILVEMGEYFDTVMKPRVLKAAYSKDWKDGKPVSREGVSQLIKVVRLESYEDTLNNLRLRAPAAGQQALMGGNAGLRRDYMLHYWVDVETEGSPSLLNVEQFNDPWAYTLEIARGSAAETKTTTVDLVESFNYLLGLRVKHVDTDRGVTKVEGQLPSGEKALVIWRKTAEMDGEALSAFLQKQRINERDLEYDVIYVNGDNHLENTRRSDETWKVRLIEEEFKRLMFEGTGR